MAYFYRTYGLALTSDTQIVGLRQESDNCEPPDVAFTLASEPDWVREAASLSCRADYSPRESRLKSIERPDSGLTLSSSGGGECFHLDYADGTRFVVQGSAECIWGTCPPPLTVEDLSTYIVGPVMGFVLRLRGVTALHASAVCVDGRAIALCGESEAGKSTTAAALALSGFSVLAEDILAIRERNGTCYVEPGYPRVCLWADSVQALFGSPEALQQLTPSCEKRFLPLEGPARFEAEARPLGAVYVLAPRVEDPDAPRIEHLGKREALLELVQNTYMNWSLDRKQRAAELDLLAKVVSNVPVRRIVPHQDLAKIGALCDLIVADSQGRLRGENSTAVLPSSAR